MTGAVSPILLINMSLLHCLPSFSCTATGISNSYGRSDGGVKYRQKRGPRAI